jgi:putative transposase
MMFPRLSRAELVAAASESPTGIRAVLGDRRVPASAHRGPCRPAQRAPAAGAQHHRRDLELTIPRLRTGSFFPSLLERRRRVDQSLFAVIMEAYLYGTSTRKVDDLVKALGADSGISKSEVSRICADLDTEVAVFRTAAWPR